MHVVGRLTGRPLTLAVDRPVDRLKDPYSRFGPVDRVNRPPDLLFFPFELPSGRPDRLTGANDSFLDELAGDRPVDPTACQMSITASFWICFVFNGFQQAFFVSKCLNTPQMHWYDLQIIFIHCLYIWVIGFGFETRSLHKFSSLFQKRKVFLAFNLQVLSFQSYL